MSELRIIMHNKGQTFSESEYISSFIDQHDRCTGCLSDLILRVQRILCMMEERTGFYPLSFVISDDVSPYFKTEPVRTQVHLEGNRLVLTCMAEGSWPLEFKWLHDNRELTKFSLEYRYVRDCQDFLREHPCSCLSFTPLGPVLSTTSDLLTGSSWVFIQFIFLHSILARLVEKRFHAVSSIQRLCSE